MHIYGKEWPRDFTNRFMIGQHTVDKDQNDSVKDALKGIKPREIVRQLADIGCDTLYFYMSCHLGNCYYPTKVKYGRIHSGIGKRDVFGEVADECAKRKIALVALYEFGNLHYLKDWVRAPQTWKHYVYPDGRRSVKGLCWNTGYGEFFLAQVEEVVRQYPVVGLYVDMLDYPGLNLCPGCVQRFRADLGAEPPTQATDIQSSLYKEYKLWTFREEARFLREIRQLVQSHVPGATVINNFHMLKCEDAYEVRDAVAYISTDPGSGMGYGGGSTVRSFQAAVFFRAFSEGKEPADILYDNGYPGLLAINPRDPYLAICSTALANGAYPCACSMWAKDGSLNQAALGLAQELYTHVAQVKPYAGNWKSLKTAGLYFSQESEFFYGHPGEKDWGQDGRYQDELHGALLMLQQEHIPVDVLTRNQLPRLSGYPVIYLPNAVCLSDVEIRAFREYVKRGGTLVSSYKTSLADEWGRPAKTFRLADVFGTDTQGAKIEPYMGIQINLVDPKRYPFLPWENPSVTLSQAGLIVRARSGAKVLANLHDRYRPNTSPTKLQAFHNAFVVEKPFGPGIVENRYGKGRSIYFAGKIFSAYLFKGVPSLRKLAARWLVAEVLAGSPVQLKAPSSVEMTAFERPEEGRWLIHLTNFQSAPGKIHLTPTDGELAVPLTEEVLPVHDLELTLRPGRCIVKKVLLQPSGMELEFEKQDHAVLAHIPKLHIHAVVEVQFTEKWPMTPERFTTRRLVPMKHCPGKETRAIVGKTTPLPQESGVNFDTCEIWDGMGMGQSGKRKRQR